MADSIHATCIAANGRAVLLRGPSGAGKSDLALRCLFQDMAPPLRQSVRLVADDRVLLRRDGQRLLAQAPANLMGKLEVRGIGIVSFPCLEEALVGLIIDLRSLSEIERLPERPACVDVLGVSIPAVALYPFEHSAPLKVLLAINTFGVAASP